MLSLCSLQSLFLKQTHSSEWSQTAAAFFRNPQSLPDDIVEQCLWHEPLLSESKAIENWKQLLGYNLLTHLSHAHQVEMAAKIRLFERLPWNQSSQYFRSLVALNHALAKMPIPEVGAHLLESGAALIDLGEYCPWASLSYHPQHLEFALFLSLLALLTKRQDLEKTALQLAQWQLNILDAAGKPMTALFVREKEGRVLNLFCLTYLFFRAASLLQPATSYLSLAESALKEIQEKIGKWNENIHPLWALIEKWLEQFKLPSPSPYSLPEQIYDPSTALVGYRSPSQHVVCTLHGGHTGLGAYRFEGVEIVNYGPQYLPLGECQGFGIEGNALSDHGMRRSVMEWRPHSFSLKGCTRLVDQPSSTPLEMGNFRGIWLEVSQEFKKPDFYLKTSLLGLDGWESVAFTFFVKAERCRTQQAQTCLYPRKLERFEGATQTLCFETGRTALELRPLNFKGTMQVIPLAGGNNFWGADFLVAYLLAPDQRNYQWHVGPLQKDLKDLKDYCCP